MTSVISTSTACMCARITLQPCGIISALPISAIPSRATISRTCAGTPRAAATPAAALIHRRFRHGLGVPRCDSEAARLYKLAAAADLPCAQFNLGFMFQMGLGVEQDTREAIRLYKRAAEQGDDDARRSLAHLRDFTRCDLTHSAALPRYVAICRALAAWRLQRHLPPQTCTLPLANYAPSQLLAARAAIEVPLAARIRVCSSGWAALASAKLLSAFPRSGFARAWAPVIAARALGMRCSVLQVITRLWRHYRQ